LQSAAGRTRNVAGTNVAPKITRLLGDSAAYDFRPFHETVDLVFIDGSHAYGYVLRDSATAMSLLRESGIILWHDYVPEGFPTWPAYVVLCTSYIKATPRFAKCAISPGRSWSFFRSPDQTRFWSGKSHRTTWIAASRNVSKLRYRLNRHAHV
jgi:hypothetical protein